VGAIDTKEISENIQNKDSFKRKLSDHVTTRLYRAPEVVLLEKDYSKPVDIWAAGVVMADMFQYFSKSDSERLVKDPNV